jgi:hypothetical protein
MSLTVLEKWRIDHADCRRLGRVDSSCGSGGGFFFKEEEEERYAQRLKRRKGYVIAIIPIVILALGAGRGGIGPSGYDVRAWLLVLTPKVILAGLRGLLGGQIARRGKRGLIVIVALGAILAGGVLVLRFAL